jgi:hypothetical protein
MPCFDDARERLLRIPAMRIVPAQSLSTGPKRYIGSIRAIEADTGVTAYAERTIRSRAAIVVGVKAICDKCFLALNISADQLV